MRVNGIARVRDLTCSSTEYVFNKYRFPSSTHFLVLVFGFDQCFLTDAREQLF